MTGCLQWDTLWCIDRTATVRVCTYVCEHVSARSPGAGGSAVSIIGGVGSFLSFQLNV